MTNAANRIVVLAKAPIRGLVKTRLAASIGDDEALRLHSLLAARTFATVLEAGCAAEVRITPDDAIASLGTWVPASLRVRPQGGGDLGDRMHRALCDAFAEGSVRVVVVGSDCPGMNVAHLAAAFAALSADDLVLGPATDGGYWLIGARAATPDVFRGVPWSTSEVRAATRRRAAAAGLRVADLERLPDVDTVEDLRHMGTR